MHVAGYRRNCSPFSELKTFITHENIFYSLQIDVDDVDIKSYIYDEGWASTFISTVVTIMRFDDKYTFKTLFKGQTFFLLSFVLSLHSLITFLARIKLRTTHENCKNVCAYNTLICKLYSLQYRWNGEGDKFVVLRLT